MKGALDDRKPEWLAERRFLLREKARVDHRLDELEAMIRAFWPGERL